LETSVFLLVIGVLGVLQVGESAPLALLGIFGYAVVRLVPGVNRMVGAANRMRFGRAAIENVYRDLVLVAPSPASLDAVKDGLAPQDEVVFEKSIKLDNTSFSYVGASHPGVLAVDFEIAKGDFVGIVGPTGSGKTTLMDLIAGLLEPSSGSVLVDGRDIRLNLAGWQSKIGIVPQNVFLIDDTLRRNIALGIPDESIDGRALAETISAAQLGEFVESLDRGLDTVVGERGVRVSGGQRQRVAIARALYHRPELLLFDEGTAALDTLTEAALLQALEGLRGNYTMVSIAHRLASVRTCDLIVLMIDGRVVDLGSYDELLIRNPTFERMAR
jgi:ATP-binding cassette subfamily C protein